MVPELPMKCELGFDLFHVMDKKKYMKQTIEYEGELYKQLRDLMLFDSSFKPGDFEYIGNYNPEKKKRRVKCVKDCNGCMYYYRQQWGLSSDENKE